MMSRNFRYILGSVFSLLMVLLWVELSQAQEKEEDYSISLVKTAEVEEGIHEVDNKRVLAQEYTIRKGDYIWKILRNKGLLKRENFAQMLSILKKLNKSFNDLDVMRPGEKIIIPLKILPTKGHEAKQVAQLEKTLHGITLEDLDFENYTVQPGDGLIRIIKGRYQMPNRILYNKYLGLFKKLNPAVKDLDVISSGQVIKLPIYSPEIVRKPIEKLPPPKPAAKKEEKKIIDPRASRMARGLDVIFSGMGEEWVQSGEHFIPLKSGGQIDLNAEFFPIINLQSGRRIIVDLENKLPDKMASLIAATWENNRIIHLNAKDDLRTAMDKILSECGYTEILERGEPLELQGEIAFRITGDWIVILSESRWDDRPGAFVVNLINDRQEYTPQVIKDYLKTLGVKVVEFPSSIYALDHVKPVELFEVRGDPNLLIKNVLELTGQAFFTEVGIPVNQSQKSESNFIISTDFFVNLNGRDAIIDLSGLAPETISFLKEHQFLVQSFAGQTDLVEVLAGTLGLLDVQADDGPHSFLASKGDDSRNIKMTLPGIVFYDPAGKPIIATSLRLPDKIKAFLSYKGYKILALS